MQLGHLSKWVWIWLYLVGSLIQESLMTIQISTVNWFKMLHLPASMVSWQEILLIVYSKVIYSTELGYWSKKVKYPPYLKLLSIPKHLIYKLLWEIDISLCWLYIVGSVRQPSINVTALFWVEVSNSVVSLLRQIFNKLTQRKTKVLTAECLSY